MICTSFQERNTFLIYKPVNAPPFPRIFSKKTTRCRDVNSFFSSMYLGKIDLNSSRMRHEPQCIHLKIREKTSKSQQLLVCKANKHEFVEKATTKLFIFYLHNISCGRIFSMFTVCSRYFCEFSQYISIFENVLVHN